MAREYARIDRWHLHNEPRELPPPPSNDTDSQGLSDAIFQGGAEYHGLLISLNPIDEAGSSIPFDEGSGIPISDDPAEGSGILISDDPVEGSGFLISEDFPHKIQELNSPLYPGCKNYSRLSFIIELYLIKSRGKMSNVTFGEVQHLLKNAFPDINIPDSFYKTKKLIRRLGCDYKKIDACENDCMLF